jgi:hypothetical protein
MTSSSRRSRRRALLVAALPIRAGWLVGALGMESGSGGTLRDIAHELGLTHTTVLQLAIRVRSTLDPEVVAAPLREAAYRIHTVVGPVLCTAKSTVPSLIEDDFAAGRTTCVHGMVFSNTELALLLAVASVAERATA